MAGIEQWRDLFRGTNTDVFDLIENAILVAASDFPQEFRHRRDRIAEKLYTALSPRCFGCGGNGEEGDGSVRHEAEKGSKVDSCCNDIIDGIEEFGRAGVVLDAHNCSYDEAEALTEEIEEENQYFGEVLRIKEIILNKEDHSDGVLFESLRRLQLMQLSVETLKETEIGKAVKGLRKHNSKQIQHLVRTLIESWRLLVNEWVSATAAIADNTPDSTNLSVIDEEGGLPFPPLDEGALLATQTTSIQLFEFFDEMDDDGNLRNNEDFKSKRDNGARSSVKQEPLRKQQPPQPMSNADDRVQLKRQEARMRQSKPQDPFDSQVKSHVVLKKQSNPSNAEAGPGRLPKAVAQLKPYGESKPRQQLRDLTATERKPAMVHEDKSKFSEEASARAKLEMAKRKLHEGYQQAENAKKQRTIQVMELHDIPKPKHNNRHPITKPRNHIRSRVNGGR